jgi:hypothetical protein
MMLPNMMWSQEIIREFEAPHFAQTLWKAYQTYHGSVHKVVLWSFQ